MLSGRNAHGDLSAVIAALEPTQRAMLLSLMLNRQRADEFAADLAMAVERLDQTSTRLVGRR